MSKLQIEYRPTASLIPYIRNARTHSEQQVAQIAASIAEFGFTNPILLAEDSVLIAGHGRLAAAQKLRLESVPTITLSGLSDAQRRALTLADNRIAENSGWDAELLKIELGDLVGDGFDVSLLGWDADQLAEILGTLDPADPSGDDAPPTLAERFFAPPFTVLNAREGWWQDRKRGWLALGIRSEIGRGEDDLTGGDGKAALITSLSGRVPDYYKQKREAEARIGRKLTVEEFESEHLTMPEGGGLSASGTSVFDPVLCEIAYHWFSPPGGLILDPFAGGSVRGVVASRMGRQYVGHELRAEQVAANREQGDAICANDNHPPAWIHGDSRNIDKTCADVQADLIFSCPPYADLEVYSDDPKDLSTMSYPEFVKAYREIIKKSCALLRQDRFACFVVGDVRDKKGNYYNFVGDTVQAFRDAGLEFYNEAILVTALGSLPIRAAKAFSSTRKLGKTHQNVLVFLKGDAKRATKALGKIEIDEAALGEAAEG